MRYIDADSKLEPVEFLADVREWAEIDHCGVTALAAITGKSATTITKQIQKARGSDRHVVGMNLGEMINTLGLLGFRADVFDHTPPGGKMPTLGAFYRGWGDRHACIVGLRSHWIALDCFGFIDTTSRGQLHGVDACQWLRSRVHSYIEVRKI